MIRVGMSITPKHIDALKRFSKETGLSVSEIVRRAIDQFFAYASARVPPAPPKSSS